MLVVGNNSTRCAIFKWYPGTCFHINIKDFGDLKYFLGIEVTPLHSSLFLSQWNYTLNILTECGMLGLYPSSFPMKQHHKLFDDSGPLFGNVGKYRRLVGRQIYLTITILEFSYSVHMLLQFIRQPSKAIRTWLCAYCDISNDGQHKGFPLSPPHYNLIGPPTLLTRQSTSGYFVTIGGSPISWSTSSLLTARCFDELYSICEWINCHFQCRAVAITEPHG